MAELTPEERQRIYEEEKARAEAQAHVKKAEDAKKSRPVLIGCGILLVLFLLLVLVSIVASPKKELKPTPRLSATVDFTGTQFIIENRDAFDWTAVTMEINPGLMAGGFALTVRRLSAKQRYTVGALQFAKSDGTRFNPFTTKVQQFVITCETPQGMALWSQRFE